MTLEIAVVLLAFVFIGYALMSGKIPGAIACMISVAALWYFGILSKEEVFSNFVSDSILCVIAMQIVCKGLMKTDILRIIAGLVQKMKGGTVVLLFSVMFVTSLLVSFIGSQITAVITVIPLAMALAEYSGLAPTILVFPAVVAAQSTLFPVPMGNAAVMYLMDNQKLEAFGAVANITMWDGKLIAFIPSLAVMLFILLGGWKLLPQRQLGESSMLDKGGLQGLQQSELSKTKQWVMYFIFIGVLAAIMFAKNLGITSVQAAMTGAILTYLCGILKEKEFFGAINWSLIFMMAFMLSFVAAVSNSGAGEYLAKILQPIFGTGNLWICCGATFIFCIAATQFMDNMGLINIIQPVVIAACVANGMPAAPVYLAVSASAVISYLTPMASPAGLFAYQLGGYSMKEMMKFGIPCAVITTIVSCVWIPLYWTMFH